MGIGKVGRVGVVGMFMRWAARLRFPYLFALTAVIFVFNLFVPDALPFVDELIMGLVAALLASLRKRNPPEEAKAIEETSKRGKRS